MSDMSPDSTNLLVLKIIQPVDIQALGADEDYFRDQGMGDGKIKILVALGAVGNQVDQVDLAILEPLYHLNPARRRFIFNGTTKLFGNLRGNVTGISDMVPLFIS